jgi:hypothetical protein
MLTLCAARHTLSKKLRGVCACCVLAAPTSGGVHGIEQDNRLDHRSGITEWESADLTADSWAVAVNGFPAGRIEKSARSVTFTDIRRDKDVLLEIFGITADGKVGERAGTTLPAAK